MVSSGPFVLGGLKAPASYYIRAILDHDLSGGGPGPFDPRGIYSSATAGVPIGPIFVAKNSTTTGVNLEIFDVAHVTGTVNKLSSQNGPVVVQLWSGAPDDNDLLRVLEADDFDPVQESSYSVFITTRTDIYARAFVDGNLNRVKDAGEDFGIAGPISVLTTDTTQFLDVTIGSSPAGSLWFEATDLAPATLPTDVFDAPMLKLALWSENGQAELRKIRVGLEGDAPSASVQAAIFRDDNGDQIFQAGADLFLGSEFFGAGVPPLANVDIGTRAISATTDYYFITLNYPNGAVPAGREIGVSIGDSVDFTFLSGQVGNPETDFPVESGLALVAESLSARPQDQPGGGYPAPTNAPAGGYDTGLTVSQGQKVEINASGFWNSGGGSSDANGLGSTGGLNGSFNIGSLVARIGNAAWFQVGVSSVVNAANAGTVYLAMNDTNYDDNTGQLSVQYRIQASSATVVWTGASGVNNNADLDSNWQGGKAPKTGERVLLDGSVSNADLNWNIFGLEIGLLTMTTSYTGTFKIVGSNNPDDYNSLTIDSDVVVMGGTINLGKNTDLAIKGDLEINNATLDMGQAFNHLKVNDGGVTVKNGGFFRSQTTGGPFDFVSIEPIFPGAYPKFDIEDATITVGGSSPLQLDDSRGLSISSFAAIASLSTVTWQNFSFNPYPALMIARSAVSALTFANLEFRVDTSSNVDASNVPAGSTITIQNSSGDRRGSPHERDPNNVVFWNPDGGGQATFSGTMTNLGTGSGTYYLNAYQAGEFAPEVNLTTAGPGAFAFPPLNAPATWYFTAWRTTTTAPEVAVFAPRGGDGIPGRTRSFARFVSPGDNVTNLNITLEDWSSVSGAVTNNSSQIGEIRVEAFNGDPANSPPTEKESQLEDHGSLPNTGGPYTLSAPATGLWMLAYIDVNNNGYFDSSFEAFGTSAAITTVANTPYAGADITITGGSAVAGGTATISGSQAHPGYIARVGANPMIYAQIHPEGSSVTVTGVRVDWLPPVAPASTYEVAVFEDRDNDGIFDEPFYDPNTQQETGDLRLGDAQIPGGVSTGTVIFFSGLEIPSLSTTSLFVALDLYGQDVSTAALRIQASTYWGLSQGALYAHAPINSNAAVVRFTVPANEYVKPNEGGTPTGLFVTQGLTLTVDSTGSWNFNQNNTVTPFGKPGTAGLATIKPAARRGELIGRVGPSPWFRIGFSTTAVATETGELFLAMNDFDGDYNDNFGKIFAKFSLSGSTVGAISGTINYPGANSGNLFVRAVQDCGPQCEIVYSTTIVTLSGSGNYTYELAGLPPQNYLVNAFVGADPTQKGGIEFPISVVAGSTAANTDFDLSLGESSISGTLSYSGVQDFGDFIIVASTSSDFEKEPIILGEAFQSTTGAFTIANLPFPNTYYIVAFRDGNSNYEPDGPEPFGVYGNSSGSISNLSALFTPVQVLSATPVTNKDVSVFDKGAITGDLVFEQALSQKPVVIIAGRGQFGSPGFQPENREFEFPGEVPAGGKIFYSVGLLRPATDYSVFAFIDDNNNDQFDAGEKFGGSASLFTIPEGGGANVNLTIKAPSAPDAVLGFLGEGFSTTLVKWSWDSAPGATSYELLTSTTGVREVLAGTATTFFDTITANANSAITGIRAANGFGTGSSTTFSAAPIATLAAVPGTPTYGQINISSAVVNWGANGNQAGVTEYEVQRATEQTGPFVFVGTVTALTLSDLSLSPQATYYYKVRAKNLNGVQTVFSSTSSAVTGAATTPSIAGVVTYTGGQRGNIVVKAYTSSGPLSGFDNEVTLPFSPSQTFFLPVSGGGQTYFLEAFVNVQAYNQTADLGEDKVQFGPTPAVSGPITGQNFTVAVDTVAPGQSSGLVPANDGFLRVFLDWFGPSADADGGALNDFAGYRVQRATSTTAPFITISNEYIVGGATGVVVGASQYTDTAPVAGINNYYRVVNVDFGNNESVPSGVVVIKPFGGGTISGSVSTFTATTSGAFRIRLSTDPSGTPYLAESTLNPFSFTGLLDGTYFLRGFRDTDSDSTQDANEPAGTHGGIVQPFPIQIVGGNTASGRTVVICDRTSITANGNRTFADLAATDCPALDRGPGHTTDLYRFTVGGGAAGSVGVGSQVQIDMFSPSFGTELFLIDPFGGVIAQNNDPAGAFIEATVNQAGVYTIEPTSFDPNRTGPYDLGLRLVGGFAGKISGTLSYSGGASGSVELQLFDSTSTTNAFPFFIVSTPTTGAFEISGLPDGTFFLRAFRDSNGNFVKDPSEPTGQFGVSASSLTAIVIQGGVLQNSSVLVALSDPAVGAVSGTISRQGTKTGTIRVEIGKKQCSDCQDIDVVQFATLSAAGAYTLPFVAPATNYMVRAYVDENANLSPDVLEPRISSFPVTVSAQSTTTLNLLVKDPGLGATGNSVLAATVTYTGTSSGTVFVGIGTDAELENILYFKTLTSTGNFTQSVIGNTSYYMGAFMDVNGNGSPEFEGEFQEPSGLHMTAGSANAFFVPLSSRVEAGTFTIYDPPDGVISGTVTYTGSTLGDIIVEASIEGSFGGEGDYNQARITRTVGVSTYSYQVRNLAASPNFRLRAFVDAVANERADFGEPFFERQTLLSVSSGTGASATSGVNVVIFDAGAAGVGGDVGQLSGDITYTGGQLGPVVVQAFTTSTFLGNPRFETTATGGPSSYQFTINNVGNGNYFLRAFKDGNSDTFFDPSFEASGYVNNASTITVSSDDPIRSGLTGSLTDVGAAAGGGANSLAGSVEYRGVSATTGPVQIMLFRIGSDIPVRVATFAYVAGPISYSFTGLDPDLYFVRGFVDYNNNRLPDSTEPLGQGSFQGVFLEGTLAGIDFDVCDRTALNTTPPGLTNGVLTATDCRSSDISGAGRAFQDKYAFSGTRGQLVSLTLSATGFTGFGSGLELLDPKGNLLFEDIAIDGDGFARIENFPLPESGVYTVAAKAFSGGVTGSYQLQYQGSAGSLGSIAGEVTYTGSQGGQVIVALFNQSNFDADGSFITANSLQGPGAFTFSSLATGASYYLGAFIDVNFNFEIEDGEDSGLFGGSTATPVYLRAGQSVTGISFAIQTTTTTTGFAGITGNLTYTGSRTGPVIVEFWPDPSFSGRPIASRRIPTGVGPYDAQVPGDLPYFIRAFVDADADFIPDTDEPVGVYSPSGTGAEPVFVPGSGQISGIDFELFDPFKKQGQLAAAGQGTLTISTTVFTAGATLGNITGTYVVGSEGISAGGLIAFGVPPGFPVPQAAAGDGQVAQSSTSITLEFPAEYPAVGLRATENIAAGSTVTFTYNVAAAPCDTLGVNTFFAGSASSGTAQPEPLFSGQPTLTINPGSASFFRARDPFFSLTQGATSQALVLDGFDNCGNIATVQSQTSVQMDAMTFDPTSGQFLPVTSLYLSTTTSIAMTNIATATFASGRSSATYYARGDAAGPFNVKFLPILANAVTSYVAVDVLPSNVLTNVSVSTVSYGVGATLATIIPNGDISTPELAFINFTLSDPSLSWRIQISSLPFRAGVTPTPIQEFGGVGQPSLGQIAWEGRYAKYIQNGIRVPSGLYYVRIDVGGGVTDDTLLIRVVSSKLTGTIRDAGVTPNLPLSGVQVDAFGRFGGGSVQSDSLGRFTFGGFAPGGYKLNFTKQNYLIGSTSVTIDSSGLITAFGTANNVTVSSTTAGALGILMQRSPALLVIPTLQDGATAAFDLWGNLQVSNASSTFVQNRPLRLPAGTTTFDDGGQWDSSLAKFVAKQTIRFEVPADTYTVRAELGGFDAVTTTGVYLASGQRTITLPQFALRPAINAAVELPAGFNTAGVFLSVSVVPLSTTSTLTGGFGDAFFGANQSSGVVRIEGLESGTYRISANADGLKTVEISSITVAAVDLSTALPVFADPNAAARIAGTITVVGNTAAYPALDGGTGANLRVHVSAWAQNAKNQGFKTVEFATAAVSDARAYTITGLDAGTTYQVFAFLEHQGNGNFDSSGGFPKLVLAANPGTLNFSFEASSGVVSGVILNSTNDFSGINLLGNTLASARPEDVGERFSVLQVTSPAAGMNFRCADGAQTAPTSAGLCPAGISSATFLVGGLNSQTVELEFFQPATGRSDKKTVSVINGATTTVTVDLREATYNLSGAILNQVTDTNFNTNAKIVANSAHIPLTNRTGGAVSLPLASGPSADVPVSTASLARVVAVKQDFAAFSVGISTTFDPAKDRVGFIQTGGTFTIRNLPPGTYVLRTENLRLCATCAVAVPEKRSIVTVTNANITGSSIALTSGFSVSGAISLQNSISDARTLELTVRNARQEVVRSTRILLGNAGTGQTANSVAYSFSNLPGGQFYTLSVIDSTTTPKYIGQPIQFPDSATAPNGLSASLTSQNLTLKVGAFVTGKLKDANSGELIRETNAKLLAPNFRITATANPWVEGGFSVAPSSVQARPILADGTWKVGPLFPGIAYDVRLGQTKWDLAFLASGSQNYAPVTLAGLIMQSGEVKDVGTVGLAQGQSIKGSVVNAASTGTALGNIKVVAHPSFGTSDILVETFTNGSGEFTIWVSTAISPQYDLLFAPRDGNQASDGFRYSTLELLNVEVTTTPLAIQLDQLVGSVTGHITTADGGTLGYPFGDKKGFPAAAVFLQKAGVVPLDNPFGDIEEITDGSGNFTIPGVATGTYVLQAVSLGYSVAKATVVVTNGGAGPSFHIAPTTNPAVHTSTITLTRGAQVTGRILLPNGSAPNNQEVGGVAAATRDFKEFVLGTVEFDPTAKTVKSYTVSGFKTGLVYDIVILPAEGEDIYTPTEGLGVTFTTAESTTTKTVNLTFSRPKPDCVAVQKGLGNNQFQIKIECSQALRNKITADSDLSTIVTIGTATAGGTALVSPNGTGSLLGSDKKFSTDRKKITAIYRAATGETRYSIKLVATLSTVDTATGENFKIEKTFDFFTGLESAKKGKCPNVQTCELKLEPTAEDTNLGRSEKFSAKIPPGSFTKCSAGDTGCTVDPSQSGTNDTQLNPQLEIRRARTREQASVQYVKAYGYAPHSLSTRDDESAIPGELGMAIAKYKTLASTNVNAASAFYDIFLPLGIRTQLTKEVNLTFSYTLPSSTFPLTDLNVWYFNTTTGRFEIENKNRSFDEQNKTVTVTVDHFSTFVVLASTPIVTSNSPFGGDDITVFNFPNPFDCTQKTKSLNNRVTNTGQITFNGTLIRYGLPSGQSAEAKFRIYNVAGELVREFRTRAAAMWPRASTSAKSSGAARASSLRWRSLRGADCDEIRAPPIRFGLLRGARGRARAGDQQPSGNERRGVPQARRGFARGRHGRVLLGGRLRRERDLLQPRRAHAPDEIRDPGRPHRALPGHQLRGRRLRLPDGPLRRLLEARAGICGLQPLGLRYRTAHRGYRLGDRHL
jgi:uncharacterized protein (DUF2141 family)